MLVMKRKFIDYNGNEREEEFMFNLTKAEVLKMEMSEAGGLEQVLKRIIAEQDQTLIMKYFDDIVLKSYGKRSPDGRRFEKSEKLTKEFMETEAYSDLLMELVTDSKKAVEFVDKILPEVPKTPDKTEETEESTDVLS